MTHLQFVNMLSRPMVDRQSVEAEVADTFERFAGGSSSITVDTLQAAMADLGRTVDPLVAQEMIQEATKGGDVSDGKISREEYCLMNGCDTAVSAS